MSESRRGMQRSRSWAAPSPEGGKVNLSGVISSLKRSAAHVGQRTIHKLEAMGDKDAMEYVSPIDANPRVIGILLAPFSPLIGYALLHLFDSWFLTLYSMFLILYFLTLIAYVVTEIAIRPPWYIPSTPEKGLTQRSLPEYWQGVVHDPLHHFGIPFDTVSFPDDESGATLRGWWVPVKHPNPELVIVFCHGGGRDRRAFLRHIPFMYAAGYPCLLFDCQEHGISDGTRAGCAYGVRESNNVVSAVRWVREVKGAKRIVAMGTSVGGASVIMAGARDPTIAAVIAENPMASPTKLLTFHAQKLVGSYTPRTFSHIVLAPFYQLVSLVFLIRLRVFGNPNARAPIKVAHLIAPRPLMLLHGDADEIVPLSHSQQILEAAKEPKQLWIVPEAWHSALLDRYPEQYQRKVLAFLDSVARGEVPRHHSEQDDDVCEDIPPPSPTDVEEDATNDASGTDDGVGSADSGEDDTSQEAADAAVTSQ